MILTTFVIILFLPGKWRMNLLHFYTMWGSVITVIIPWQRGGKSRCFKKQMLVSVSFVLTADMQGFRKF